MNLFVQFFSCIYIFCDSWRSLWIPSSCFNKSRPWHCCIFVNYLQMLFFFFSNQHFGFYFTFMSIGLRIAKTAGVSVPATTWASFFLNPCWISLAADAGKCQCNSIKTIYICALIFCLSRTVHRAETVSDFISWHTKLYHFRIRLQAALLLFSYFISCFCCCFLSSSYDAMLLQFLLL